MTIIDTRLDELDNLVLAHGQHSSLEAGACLLEAVSYIAGEPWSDHPECVCPALGAFGRSWNDALSDEARNRILKPFTPRLVGTRSTPKVQDARAFMAADWAVRTYTPAWLRLAGLNEEAVLLESLPQMASTALCKAAMPTIEIARKRAAAAGAAAAGAAAWAAAAGAAAAWAAAGAAAGAAAAWAAAGAAAAWAAAWAAAGAAAAGAAAAGAALAPTVELLQVSAADLFDRMILVTA